MFKEGETGVVGTESLGKYLQNELGWSLKQQQELSLGEAIQQPEKFLQKRKDNIDKIFATRVQPAYERGINELKDTGLPDEVLKNLLMKRAENAYLEAMEVENLRHPGYSRALGAQEANRDRIEDRFTKDERRAIKQKAIAKYKARKRAKRVAK